MDEVRDWAVGVRVEQQRFAADVEAMRASLEGPLEKGAERAGRAVEGALLKAVRTGKLGFEDLKSVALSAMDAIAAAALKGGIGSILGGRSAGSGQAGGLAGVLAGVLAGGLPGRATGGPVGPARAYMVGERGPELFVPTAAGRVEAAAAPGASEVRVAITVNAPAGSAPEMLQRSGRQVARAVRAALEN